ncbi:MAG: deoxyhypusine synthase family protein [Spirochaetaceae bacterium]|nr:MAG: deoxyhypusine synthase family protein [Spirochaetaceae bacterium]
MPFPKFDRNKIHFYPLHERQNRVFIEEHRVLPSDSPASLNAENQTVIHEAGRAIREARSKNCPVVVAFGAHTIKNGLSPVLIQLIETGWVSHLATNGAGIIHDWEFAYAGSSSEDVRENVGSGRFGIWEETGKYLNLALLVGAYEGLGYGESIGSLVHNDGMTIPSKAELIRIIGQVAVDPERTAAAADLLWAVDHFKLSTGFLQIKHPYKKFGLQAAAFRLKVPFTGHPMFGHDIIYTHPLNRGAAVGRTAERDFLIFAKAIADLEGGVYISLGSAVMSPMIFEKSLSMARNLAIQEGRKIDDFSIYVVDLAGSNWNWQKDGEPPADNPAYYVRFMKTFSRMGGRLHYVQADNRDFLLALHKAIQQR